MGERIAIVGTGPTGVYTLHNLLKLGAGTSIHLYEKGRKAGVGMPYSPETASRSMLANIASIEIPPLSTTYLDWLKDQPPARLRSYGIDEEDLDDRQFTPRLLLGEYFRDQLLALVDRAREAGVEAELHENTEVTNVVARVDRLFVETANGVGSAAFDRVILATGHEFPEADEATRSYFPSPWSGLIQASVPAVRVGIMGASLSSMDAAMAVACQHGRFRRRDGELEFQTSADGLTITLMSWTGVLPEADFYCPIPHEPLLIMTDEAVAACAAGPRPLDALFELMRAEINEADPAYAQAIDLPALDVDAFADAYFAAREAQDPFRWARSNLEEVEYNKARKITVPWRYALLRMHETVADIVPSLSEADRARFDAGLKTVFVDNYAAVPSQSIRRLLALRDAGVLSILALGEDYDLTRESDRTIIRAKGATHVFDVFIDARGQKPMASADLPFPSLRRALIDSGQDTPELAEDFSLIDVEGYAGRVNLAALPYLMRDRPFVQGVTACAEIGEAIAKGASDLSASTSNAAVTTKRRGKRLDAAYSPLFEERSPVATS